MDLTCPPPNPTLSLQCLDVGHAHRLIDRSVLELEANFLASVSRPNERRLHLSFEARVILLA